jgi:S-formylglutathione hydrolase FrmB
MWQLTRPTLGGRPDAIERMSRNNPIEMLERLDIRPGQFQLYVAYAGRDQFNIDAQVDSFLYAARKRGIEVGVGYEPEGRHSMRTAEKLFPGIIDWLAERLKNYPPVPK